MPTCGRRRGLSGASWGHLSRPRSKTKVRTARIRTKVPGSGGISSGAAYRNRTDDLRITRRTRAIHGHPGSHINPAGAAPRSAGVRSRPGPLLANPLARSARPLLRFWRVAALRRVGPLTLGPRARRVRGQRCFLCWSWLKTADGSRRDATISMGTGLSRLRDQLDVGQSASSVARE
jgi:hypothetical protein